jgi:branched-chain amino acid transport system ATP-binding protein
VSTDPGALATSLSADVSDAARSANGHARPASLNVDGVTVRFGGIVAVNDVSLEIPHARCVSLIGPNGAGKTTLLDAMSGLRIPSTGRIRLADRDVTKRSATWLARRGVRRTFQRHQVFGRLSVADNVIVALEWRHRGRGLFGDLVTGGNRRKLVAERYRHVDEILDRCGLAADRDRSAAELPIGKVRLLEFARAVVDRPAVLLLDEPTSGLAPAQTELLGSMIRELIEESGTSVVLVEHDVDFVMEISDHVVCLQEGALIAEGSPAEIRQNPLVIAAYLGAGE